VLLSFRLAKTQNSYSATKKARGQLTVMNIQELFDRLKGLEGRLAEDEVYKIVWEETQSGNFDPAAQARAAVEVGTDKEALRAAYIKHRVRRIYDELEAEKNRFQAKEIELERTNEENERRRHKEEVLAKEQKRKVSTAE
jgi:hypothetical protein